MANVIAATTTLVTTQKGLTMRESFIAIDFQTDVYPPESDEGARTTEVAAVLVRNGDIADIFQSRMNPGVSIPRFFQGLTGISNRTIAAAPPSDEVMKKFFAFIDDTPLVAHDALRTEKMLNAELSLIGRRSTQPMLCSSSIARRVYPKAPDYWMSTLAKFTHIETDGLFYRPELFEKFPLLESDLEHLYALINSEMTARLMLQMAVELRKNYGVPDVTFQLMRQVQSMDIRDAQIQLRKLADS